MKSASTENIKKFRILDNYSYEIMLISQNLFQNILKESETSYIE